MKITILKKYLYRYRFSLLIINSLLTILLLIGCYQYSVLDSFHPAAFDSSSQPENIYSPFCHHVTCDIPLLYYSGYDYLLNNHVYGHYYYSLQDNNCTIYLISQKYIGLTDTPPEQLENVQIKAKLLKNDSNLKPLLQYMAADLDWNSNGLSKVTNSYIISQVDYNMPFNVVMIIFTIISFISNIFLFIIFYKNRRKKHIPT